MARRIALLSCVKSKLAVPAAAKDLYVSNLFQSMRKYAENACDEWFVLSAEHGLLRPDQQIAPYERTLLKMPKADRTAWFERVSAQLVEALPPKAEVVILAGARYRADVVPFLRSNGFLVKVPMAGLRLGHQLQWLKGHTR